MAILSDLFALINIQHIIHHKQKSKLKTQQIFNYKIKLKKTLKITTRHRIKQSKTYKNRKKKQWTENVDTYKVNTFKKKITNQTWQIKI